MTPKRENRLGDVTTEQTTVWTMHMATKNNVLLMGWLMVDLVTRIAYCFLVLFVLQKDKQVGMHKCITRFFGKCVNYMENVKYDTVVHSYLVM